jgi:hypothetical protein
VAHLLALLEESSAVIRKQFAAGKASEAAQLQWTWVIDFLGFGLRDQNPYSAFNTAKLMQNFPGALGDFARRAVSRAAGRFGGCACPPPTAHG